MVISEVRQDFCKKAFLLTGSTDWDMRHTFASPSFVPGPTLCKSGAVAQLLGFCLYRIPLSCDSRKIPDRLLSLSVNLCEMVVTTNPTSQGLHGD